MTPAEVRALAAEVVEAWKLYSGVQTSHFERTPETIAKYHRDYLRKLKELGKALDEPDAGLSVYSACALIRLIDDASALKPPH